MTACKKVSTSFLLLLACLVCLYLIPPADSQRRRNNNEEEGGRFTTFAPNKPQPVTSPRPISNKPPGFIFHANRVQLGPDFKPLYKGKVIHRYQLNLTEAARLVDPVPDYYAPGEGPEEDDEVDDGSTGTTNEIQSTTPTPSSGGSHDGGGDHRFTTFAPNKPQPVTSPRPISNKPPGFIFHANRVKLGPDFKPLYKGKVIHRYQLNLTEAARLVDPVPDYYAPGEGPEDDEEDDQVDNVEETPSVTPAYTTRPTSAPAGDHSSHSGKPHHEEDGGRFTTFAPNKPQPVTSPRPISNKPPGFIFHANRVKLGPDFKPLYKGKVIHRYQLNLTEAARLVDPVPDYYAPGEGPEDDEEDLEDNSQTMTATSPMPTSSTTPSTHGSSDSAHSSQGGDHFTTFAPNRPAPVTSPRPISKKPPGFIFHANRVVLGPDFKPLYKGKVIHRYQLNLTEAARLVDPVPDYYEPGEGPGDDDDDAVDDTVQPVASSTEPSVSSAGSSSSGSDDHHHDHSAKPHEEGGRFTTFAPNKPPPVTSPRPISKKPPGFIFHANRVVLGPDFKPLYKGKVIHRYELNLTEAARLVDPVPDYYEPGEGPMDDDDDEEADLVGGDSNDLQRPSSTSTTSTTTTTTTSTAAPSGGNAFNSFNPPEYDDVDKPEDVDLAVGGISGIFQKIIQGPKSHELNNNSSPEEVYLHLSTIVRDESSKALKATIPRIYDYQYPIGSLLTQRCFNSFAQFGDRMRRGLVWPMRMITASSGISANFALRDYGDFDRCLNVVADDDERRPTEQFFTGQYCMMQLELPLPALNRNISYLDKVLHFNDTELGGTFAEFVSENAPFLYSNPKSSGICVPSTCLPSEIEDVLHYFFKKFHIKVRFNIDCYSKVNLTVNALPGDMVGMDVKELLANAISPSLSTRLGRLSSVQFWTIIYILVSVVLVLLATLYEVRQIGRSSLRCWASTERNRPKSFIACFSARYNLEQVASVRDRHMYEMPPPPMPQQANSNINININNNNSTTLSPGQQHQANININVSCADDSSTNDSSSETGINPKDYLGTGMGGVGGGVVGLHQSPVYGQVVNTASVDGLKVFALLWICMANFYLLGYQPQMLPSVEHLRDVIMDAKDSSVYQLVTQSWLSMEIFFLLSGFLMAYTALPYIARHDGRPNLLYFVAKRALRFLPSMITLLLCLSLLPLWKNAGPLYNSGVESILGPCRRFYWRDLFFSSNFYTYEHTCLPHLWYLSVEFQLTLIGIFVSIFAFNRSKHAWKAFGALIAVGVFASGYFAYNKQVNITSPLFEKAYLAEIPAILKVVYFSTPVHFSAYFGGLAIGYYARIHNTTRCVPPKAVRVILWTVLPLLTLLAIYLPQHWPFKATFKYGRTMTALYYATFRLLFVSSFAWALFECLHHRASAIKSLLSTSFCRMLSQLSYQIYLINVMVISVYLFTRRTTIQPTTIETLALAAILFVITLVIAFFSYLLFEAPYRALFRYYLESPRVLNYMLPVVNANGGKPNGNGNGMPFSKGSMLNLNPNFLFSPHYNMVTNLSSRCESEASSLANFSMGSPTITAGSGGDQVLSAQPPPPTTNLSTTTAAGNNSAAAGAAAVANAAAGSTSSIPKSVSSISMVPNGEVADFNNNKNSGEAYA